jgi:hypothetical protein
VVLDKYVDKSICLKLLCVYDVSRSFLKAHNFIVALLWRKGGGKHEQKKICIHRQTAEQSEAKGEKIHPLRGQRLYNRCMALRHQVMALSVFV